MNGPFRIRHARTLGGGFLLLCLVGLALAMGTSGGWRDLWRRERVTFLVSCPVPYEIRDKDLDLPPAAPGQSAASTKPAAAAEKPATFTPIFTPGARVEMLGQTVGSVDEVFLGDKLGREWPQGAAITDECLMIGRVTIHGQFARLLNTNATVYVQEDLGGFGGVFLKVSPGAGGASPTAPLAVKASSSARGNMEDLAKQLENFFFKPDPEGQTLAKRLTSIVDTANTALKSYTLEKDERDSLKRSLASFDKLLANLERDKLESQFPGTQKTLTHVQDTLKSLDVLLNKLGSRKIEDEFPEWKNTMKALVETLAEINDTNNRLQDTWLLRGKGADKDEANKKAAEKKATDTPTAPPPRPHYGIRKG